MNTLDINTIAFHYLLRTDSQKNNSKIEESKRETLKYNPEQYIKEQKSLLAQLYNLEEEDLFI
ncbi:hypothetical protein [Flavobacterium hibernum]|uniref:Uncharacterized protein n=1 Tax=Flavobacterium hibernum TaxID=37752 RepID=A0A0D0EMG9_9FLAO|nr:hypothetical protein [Flavobacterium hibernum]KIO53740.1 hypothetical protein IW18_05190 [Flavobacterium hibernum]OXA90652.1 hypothetical protein B0A73_02650 [Flavobacterium hibernum]STO14931.1 Uncharacterised protein [Flavobacterium hibernum]